MSQSLQDKLANLKSLAGSKHKENKKFFARLRSKKPKNFDKTIHQIHDEVFACTDCLQCANCCKTTGPKFTQKDVERIASHFNLRPAEFMDQYLQMDEDGDTVLQQVPCPFLDSQNYCTIYDIRPKACRQYPHTNQVGQLGILPLTLKNIEICPAVYEITERMKDVFPV